MNELLKQELEIKGHIRAFVIGSFVGLASGLIVCGHIRGGAFIGLVAGILGYISQPKYQRIRNV